MTLSIFFPIFWLVKIKQVLIISCLTVSLQSDKKPDMIAFIAVFTILIHSQKICHLLVQQCFIERNLWECIYNKETYETSHAKTSLTDIHLTVKTKGWQLDNKWMFQLFKTVSNTV